MFEKVPTPLVVSYGSLTAQVPTGNLTGKKLPVGNLGTVIIKERESYHPEQERDTRSGSFSRVNVDIIIHWSTYRTGVGDWDIY